MHPRLPFLLGGTLTLLLAACGQPQMQQPAEADPYANGASFPWAYTAPEGKLITLSLTPGENNLYFEPILAAKNGWGPIEIDRSNGEQAAGDGRPLSINGKTYSRGFGTHAGSELRFSLQGTGATCTRFTADVGVDDEVGPRGKVVFQVYLDGVKAYDSGVMKGKDAARRVDLDITGKGELRLVVTDAGNGINFDHADWADPKISCQAVQTPPTTGKPGTFDLTFDGDGYVAFPNAGQTGFYGLSNLLQLPNGNLLAIAFHDRKVVQFTPDGQFNRAFGNQGVALLPSYPRRAVLQGGRLLVLGCIDSYCFEPAQYVLNRLLADGTVDSTFGVNGTVTIEAKPSNEGVSSGVFMELQPDGKVIVATAEYDAPKNPVGSGKASRWKLQRYTQNGALDSTFGTAGASLTDVGDDAVIRDMVIQPDGRIVLGGVTGTLGGQAVTLIRYTQNGQVDASFAGGALRINSTATRQELHDLELQPDGKLLAAATLMGDEDPYLAKLARINTNGTLDAGFGVGGVASFAPFDQFNDIELQPDGKILGWGNNVFTRYYNPNQPYISGLARLTPQGQTDTTFGTSGIARIVLNDAVSGSTQFNLFDFLVQDDGKIVLSGYTNTGYNLNNGYIVRLLP